MQPCYTGMRSARFAAAVFLITIGCSGGSSPAAAHTPLPTASPQPTSPLSPLPVANAYGLLLTNGMLELITPDGRVGASVAIAPPTVRTCVAGLNAWLQPPVSATSDKVFFRDGDTRIRSVTPTGMTADATTVPGDANTISFFSVSPDDKRIAVVVEDFSSVTTIALRLYVEDVNGRGNHVDIYATTTPRSDSATTLWPMGWHKGQLLLAQMTGCTNTPTLYAPSEWHVVDPSTANRVATITSASESGTPPGSTCTLSYWPSSSGVACAERNGIQAHVVDWSGAQTARVQIGLGSAYGIIQSGLSPSGQGIFLSTVGTCGEGGGCPAWWTAISVSFRAGGTDVLPLRDGTGACLWIDDTHLLAADSVLTLSVDAGGHLAANRTFLPAWGQCAGRFPGAF